MIMITAGTKKMIGKDSSAIIMATTFFNCTRVLIADMVQRDLTCLGIFACSLKEASISIVKVQQKYLFLV